MTIYRAFVFGLKYNRNLDEKIEAVLKPRNLVVYPHNGNGELARCGRPHLHYHGVVEFVAETDISREPAFLQLCTYFKYESIENPFEYLAPLKHGSGRVVLRCDAASDFSFRVTAFDPDWALLQRQKEENALCVGRRTSTIKFIIEVIQKSGKHDRSSVKKFVGEVPDFLPCFEQAVKIAQEIGLRMPITQLCNNFQPLDPQSYLTPTQSLEFVLEWCSFQNIAIEQFALDWIHLMDSKSPGRNTLYFQGESYCGKTYIVDSIKLASNFFGVIMNETTGCKYAYQQCTGKRLIVMMQPHFDLKMSGVLKHVLEGTGTTINLYNDSLVYLKPTPVVITSNNHCWASCPQLKPDVQSRLINSYTGLRCCRLMVQKFGNKQLHPAWLSLLYDQISKASERRNPFSKPRSGELVASTRRPSLEHSSILLSPQMSPPEPFTGTGPSDRFIGGSMEHSKSATRKVSFDSERPWNKKRPRLEDNKLVDGSVEQETEP